MESRENPKQSKCFFLFLFLVLFSFQKGVVGFSHL